MLGLITTKATILAQPVEPRISLAASTSYFINTENIVKSKLYGTTDTLVLYQLNKHDDKSTPFYLVTDQTLAQIQAMADVNPDHNLLPLPVFPNATSFSTATGTTTTQYFNINSISWVEQNAGATLTKVLVEEGGRAMRTFYVDYSLAEFVTLLVTTTTTTTSTSSTSTTSTYTTSTSTTSTSSTSSTTTHD